MLLSTFFSKFKSFLVFMHYFAFNFAPLKRTIYHSLILLNVLTFGNLLLYFDMLFFKHNNHKLVPFRTILECNVWGILSAFIIIFVIGLLQFLALNTEEYIEFKTNPSNFRMKLD